jgi:NAD(P)H dehydrogenase (quinone)
MAIVVTGATGRLGRLAVEALLERGVAPAEIVATGRSLDKIADLADRGVRVERLDYLDVPDGLLGSGDVVLFVSGSEIGQRVDQHRNVIDAAARAGVARIVYTSAPSADDTTLIVAPEHAATEKMIRESGLTFTFLRNGWYSENYQQSFQQAAGTGVVIASAGQGRVASAPIADFARAAAVAVSSEGHDNAVYELSGDVAWSYDDLAAAFGEVLGREVAYRPLSPEEHRAALLGAGLDEATAGFLVALDQNTREGLLGVTTGELGKLLGRPTTPIIETVRTWA